MVLLTFGYFSFRNEQPKLIADDYYGYIWYNRIDQSVFTCEGSIYTLPIFDWWLYPVDSIV